MFYKFGTALVNLDRLLSITAVDEKCLLVLYEGGIEQRLEAENPQQILVKYREYEEWKNRPFEERM